MSSQAAGPSASTSIPAERRKERGRDREKYSDSDAGPSRAHSRERDRDYDRDRIRDTGEKKKRKRLKRKGKDKPVLNGILNGLRDATLAKKARANTTFEMGEDFIGFASSSEDENGEKKNRDADKAPVREWDKGKSRAWDRDEARDRQGSATKRKYDFVFDDDELLNQRRPERIQRKAPWVTAVDWENCSNVAEMLHREVEAFVNYMSPTPVEDEIRSLIIDLVSKAVTDTFPDAQVLPFGSFGTKLYLPLGDIDLVIQSESMAYSDTVTVLHALANTIRRAGITTKVTIIAKAKVPILKFVTIHGRLSVDISINQRNGVVASQIVNGFLKDMHGGGMALRSLVMITKAFLSQRSMNEVYTGGLGSYSIVCLAVSFLQMHPKIRKGEIDAENNLGVLVMEFFELYGCYFNYEEVGISVRDGGHYFSKRERGWIDYYKTNLLSIEDPTDPSNDISKGSYAIQKVRTTFAGAHGILSAAAYIHAGVMRSQQNGRSFSFQRITNPEDVSILAKILGVTQETINHRRLIQEVYEDRTLHRLLGVEPRNKVLGRRSKPESSRGERTSKPPLRSAQAIEEVFEEVDMEMESEDDAYRRREPSDDEGRYGIASRNQQPNKRRRVETKQDVHTVFTTDDEDEEEGLLVSNIEGDSEYDEYASGGGADERRSQTQKAARRSYWLSKGIGTGGGHGDSS